MLAAAAAAAPDEACGLLFGRYGVIEEASLAPNIAANRRTRFEIDPAALFDAHRRHREGRAQLLGCWHSHPEGPAVPSRHDRAGVGDMGWLWLIVAHGGIHGFRPTATGFDVVALVVAAK